MTQKLFKTILPLFLLILPFSLIVSSCGDDDDEDAPTIDITGEWFYDGPEGELYMEFEKNAFEGEVYDNDSDDYAYFRGSYTVSGNQITLNIASCSNPEDFYQFEAGTTLTATMNNNIISLKLDGFTINLSRDI